MPSTTIFKTPPPALKFARRNDLLCRGLQHLTGDTFAALFVERVGRRWAIYLKEGWKRAHKVFFPSEEVAKDVWRTLRAGELSPVIHHSRYPVRQDERPADVSQIDVSTEVGRWLLAYVASSNPTEGKVRDANRIVALLSGQGMDIMSRTWWEANIPEQSQAKSIHLQAKKVVEALGQTLNKRPKATRSYMARRIRITIDALLYARLMSEDVYPHKGFDKLADALRMHFKAAKPTDFMPINNYQPLGVGDLELLLKALAKRGLRYYNFAILCLSTVIRYRDIKGLTKAHLGADNRLIYSREVLGRFLSNKTVESGKVDPTRLANPTTSVVTRVILRHLAFRPLDDRAEREVFGVGSDVREGMTPHGREHGVIRCLRTTGATMLSESGNSEGCRRISKKEVVERLAHVNSRMLDTIYGRSRPPEQGDEGIDEYFDLPELVVNGVRVNDTEAAFDVWLLGHMLETYKGRNEEADLKAALQKEVTPKKAERAKRTVKVG